MNRYRFENAPRALALIAAISFTAAMLAGVHAEAQPERTATISAKFTGEVTAHGPVYRLPFLYVTARRTAEIALPDLIERAFGGYPPSVVPATPPNA
jgi:hypothetical protein